MKPLLRIPPAIRGGSGRAVILRVELLNDAGERAACIATACTTDDAVAAAEDKARAFTGDDSWTMNEWAAV